MGFGIALRRYKIHSKPWPLLQKTCIFYSAETLAANGGVCLRMHALARVCLLTYVGQGPLWSFYFPK